MYVIGSFRSEGAEGYGIIFLISLHSTDPSPSLDAENKRGS